MHGAVTWSNSKLMIFLSKPDKFTCKMGGLADNGLQN